MKYNELFNAITCRCVVIFEDDFTQSEYKKETALYYITRMDLIDRQKYLEEVKKHSSRLEVQLIAYLDLCDQYFDNIKNWDEKTTRGDIRSAFSVFANDNSAIINELEQKYADIDDVALEEAYVFGMKYGVGLAQPPYFTDLYDEYIFRDHRAKSIRVYNDFTAESKSLFEMDLQLATDTESIVCIIDNNLAGTNRANEIIETIKIESKTNRKNIVGNIFSSKEKFEEIDDSLYFEFVSKDTPGKLKTSIAKSAYNYFISRLEGEMIETLSKAFRQAKLSKGIAYYLSRKALKEGESEYQVIMDWIRLMCNPQKEGSKAIKHLITLSRVINNLDEEDVVEELPDLTLENYNTSEAFDYTVNDYYLPAMPGDIFTNSKGEWYVLIGQDCDMTRRGNGRPPNNSAAELLPAKIWPQNKFKKWAKDLEKVSICSFKSSEDSASEILQVDYTQRKFALNEMINLCSFNSDGQCFLPKSAKLDENQKKLIPEYMINYYNELQCYYESVMKLRELAATDLKTVMGQVFSPRFIPFDEFTISGERIQFDLRRVCRLTHKYVFYLYKLYLEHRGRQPFESINLVQQEELTIPVTKKTEATDIQMTFRCILHPLESKLKKMLWVIEKDEINQILARLDFEGCVKEDQYISEEKNEIQLGGSTLIMTKMNEKVDFKMK